MQPATTCATLVASSFSSAWEAFVSFLAFIFQVVVDTSRLQQQPPSRKPGPLGAVAVEEATAVAAHKVSRPPPQAAFNPQALGCLSQLPQDLVVQLALSFDPPSLAALSAVSVAGRQQIWEEPSVWRCLGRRCDRAACEVEAQPPPSRQQQEMRTGAAAREAFRRSFHKLGMDELSKLGGAAQEATGEAALLAEPLQELARRASGLMPEDGTEVVDALLLAGEQLLQAHDPSHEESVAAAEGLLRTLHRRNDVLSWLQCERLACVRANAISLHALMDELVDKTADANDDVLEGEALWEAASGAPDEQRLQDVCARFEELFRSAAAEEA